MKSSLEYFIQKFWPYLPEQTRVTLTDQFERFRTKANWPFPARETQVFYESEEIKSRFPVALPLKISDLTYSLVCTCKNEVAGLEIFIKSIGDQVLLPKEVLICDAGSNDGTFERLEQWGRQENRFLVKVIREEGANIANGRNLAANLSTTKYLLFTDLGTKLDSRWASYLCSSFQMDQEIDYVMGYYKPVFSTWWHEPLSYFLLPRWELIDPQTFFASARSLAIKKTLFDEVSGFPESLTFAAEDSLFNYNVKLKAKKIAFVPEAISSWQMDIDPIKMWRSVFRYAKGDAETGFLFWGYYRELIIKVSKLSFDFLVFGFLNILAGYLDMAFFPEIMRMISYVFFLLGSYRMLKISREYGVFLIGDVKEKAKKFFVLWCFLSAQTCGFMSGYKRK